MNYSKHVQTRMSQRAIDNQTVKIISDWGRYKNSYESLKIVFGKKEHKLLEKKLKGLLQKLDKIKGKTLILSEEDDLLITSY